jgi:hypothetical protein
MSQVKPEDMPLIKEGIQQFLNRQYNGSLVLMLDTHSKKAGLVCGLLKALPDDILKPYILGQRNPIKETFDSINTKFKDNKAFHLNSLIGQLSYQFTPESIQKFVSSNPAPNDIALAQKLKDFRLLLMYIEKPESLKTSLELLRNNAETLNKDGKKLVASIIDDYNAVVPQEQQITNNLILDFNLRKNAYQLFIKDLNERIAGNNLLDFERVKNYVEANQHTFSATSFKLPENPSTLQKLAYAELVDAINGNTLEINKLEKNDEFKKAYKELHNDIEYVAPAVAPVPKLTVDDDDRSVEDDEEDDEEISSGLSSSKAIKKDATDSEDIKAIKEQIALIQKIRMPFEDFKADDFKNEDGSTISYDKAVDMIAEEIAIRYGLSETKAKLLSEKEHFRKQAKKFLSDAGIKKDGDFDDTKIGDLITALNGKNALTKGRLDLLRKGAIKKLGLNLVDYDKLEKYDQEKVNRYLEDNINKAEDEGKDISGIVDELLEDGLAHEERNAASKKASEMAYGIRTFFKNLEKSKIATYGGLTGMVLASILIPGAFPGLALLFGAFALAGAISQGLSKMYNHPIGKVIFSILAVPYDTIVGIVNGIARFGLFMKHAFGFLTKEEYKAQKESMQEEFNKAYLIRNINGMNKKAKPEEVELSTFDNSKKNQALKTKTDHITSLEKQLDKQIIKELSTKLGTDVITPQDLQQIKHAKDLKGKDLTDYNVLQKYAKLIDKECKNAKDISSRKEFTIDKGNIVINPGTPQGKTALAKFKTDAEKSVKAKEDAFKKEDLTKNHYKTKGESLKTKDFTLAASPVPAPSPSAPPAPTTDPLKEEIEKLKNIIHTGQIDPTTPASSERVYAAYKTLKYLDEKGKALTGKDLEEAKKKADEKAKNKNFPSK